MADNVELDAGSGGAVIATDDDGVAQHQYVKLEAGADGTQTKIHAGGGVEANALRVTVASDSTGVLSVDDNGGSLTVDGTVAVTGVATDAKLDTIIGHVDGLETALTAANASIASTAVMDDVVFGGGTEAAAQRVTIATDSTGVLSVDDNGGSLTVDGTVAVSGTVAVTDNAGSLTVDNGGTFAVQAAQSGTWTVQPGNTANTTAWKVDGSAVTQPVSGTVTANPSSGTITTVTTVGTLTGGGVAHDGADSGNPVKVGMKAGTADITAVANNDRTDMRADTLGHQVIRPYALHENLVSGGTVGTPLTNTTSTSMIASAGAGRRNYITAITVTNAHATVGTVVQIRDGSGGTILWEGYAAPVGGGVAISFPTPLRGSAATAVHGVCVTTGSSTSISVSGYTSAV